MSRFLVRERLAGAAALSAVLSIAFIYACGTGSTGAAPRDGGAGEPDSTGSPDSTVSVGSDDASRPADAAIDAGSSDSADDVVDAGFDIGASVLQHHNHANRDGLYIDPLLTKDAAAELKMESTFNAPLMGPVYAQPLYVENGPGGKEAFIVATEQDIVYAFDAASGALLWHQTYGTPVPLAKMPCGNIDPLGITGTPVIDLPSRTLFFAAQTTPDDGTTKRHLIFAVSLDDGSIRGGWPVDLSATLTNPAFDSGDQGQRGALAFRDGVLYVPYGSPNGDCGYYHGWVVGVPLADPTEVKFWNTGAIKGGLWAVSGVVADETSMFVTTGNTQGATTWVGGEAVIRFGAGPVFSNQPVDYFAPANWQAMDGTDRDLGSVGAIPVDVPDATPSRLMAAFGKDKGGYLLNRDNLGGIGGEIFDAQVATNEIIGATASYRTATGNFLVIRVANGGTGLHCPTGQGGDYAVLKVNATSPPTLSLVWCSLLLGSISPIVTSTDGTASSIVWSVSNASGPFRLYGYDGETGAQLFDGGGPGDVMSQVHYYQSPIVEKGRIVVVGANNLYVLSPH